MHFATILRSVVRLGVPLAVALVLAACATRSAAPVEERRTPTARPTTPPTATTAPAPAAAPRPIEGDTRPSTYTVKRGDTLAAIALEFGLDYRELAGWNGIENPDRILVGQVIRMVGMVGFTSGCTVIVRCSCFMFPATSNAST